MATKPTAKAQTQNGAAGAPTDLANTHAASQPAEAAQAPGKDQEKDPNAGVGGLYRLVAGQRVLVERTQLPGEAAAPQA